MQVNLNLCSKVLNMIIELFVFYSLEKPLIEAVQQDPSDGITVIQGISILAADQREHRSRFLIDKLLLLQMVLITQSHRTVRGYDVAHQAVAYLVVGKVPVSHASV